MSRNCRTVFGLFCWLLALGGTALAQRPGGTLRGQVTDASGAVIPGAAITVTNAAGTARTVATNAEGSYVASGLAPGRYTVRAVSKGFVPYENTAVEVAAGRTLALDISLRVALEKQEVTVQDAPGTTVSTEPTSNVGALVLRAEDLEALPDDPDDLAADLQALAGPSAGPNGGQIFIDGFTGGRLPPKESIREIRINQNPFSAEYDRLGFGRIEVFTKPGSDKYRGQTSFNFSDAAFNSRNPYAANKPPYQSRLYGGNLSGPINKRSSFFLDFERREIDDNAVINASILDPELKVTPFSEAVVTPQRRTTFSPRFDYQLNPNHTLVGRYTYTHVGQDNAGIGQFSLLSRAYNTLDTEQTVQLTETAVLSAKAINETRFQYLRHRFAQTGDNSIPTVNVLEAFTGGGAQVGRSFNREDHWELQNYTSFVRGTHALKIGGRLRAINLSDISPQNFGGTFTFAGGFAPELDANNQIVPDDAGQPVLAPITSLERYRRTLLFQQQGLPPEEIRRLGGGATQFSIAGGNPEADVTQFDLGVFLQDDWRVRPHFTVSLGLRYETQNHLQDWTDFGPRLGFAWAPGGSAGRQAKTVVRGGFGVFYDRFGESLTLQAVRFNGVNQEQFIVSNPNFFPTAPSLETLGGQRVAQTIRRIDSSLRAPYTLQSAIGIERQLPRNTTAALTFTNSRAVHLLRSRNINAPLAGALIPGVPGSGERPYGDAGNLYLYESTGELNQNQMITNVNSRMNRSVTLFAFYVLNYARSNTDGPASFPANQYDLSREYGRSALDQRHRFFLGGSLATRWNLRLSPFIFARSGGPFNITTGRDANGDTVFTDRPALATDLTRPGVVTTPFGAFDPNPSPGETIVPRNYGDGPGLFSVNLRLSKTFGFGPRRESFMTGGMPGGGGGGQHRGGPTGMRMGGGGGFHNIFGDATTDRRYNLIFSVSARNLLNHTNPGTPIGNLTSPFFGRANSLAGGFGPGAMAANRRLDLQLRFTF